MQKQLRKSEIKDITPKLEKFGVFLSKKDDVVEIGNMLIINGKKDFFFHEGMILPRLDSDRKYFEGLRKVTVDMGAVKFVASGADIMRPGIKEIDPEIGAGEAVAVIDEKNKVPIAIGIAMFSGRKMQEMISGKVLRTIHYPNDDIWNS